MEKELWDQYSAGIFCSPNVFISARMFVIQLDGGRNDAVIVVSVVVDNFWGIPLPEVYPNTGVGLLMYREMYR